MKKRIIIILSKHEKFLDSAKKVKAICNINTEIHYIEDFINNTDYIEDNDIIFILTNSPLIPDFVNMISHYKCYIINKDYFLNNYSKLDIQKVLAKNNISIPNIIQQDELDKCKYPIFVKENNHAGIVFQAYTPKTIETFFSKFPIDNYYFEDNLYNKCANAKEYKLYYANGVVSYKDGVEKENKTVNNMVINIAKTLKMQIISTDIILIGKECFVIDVNPAPGFYFCSRARKELVAFMEGLK